MEWMVPPERLDVDQQDTLDHILRMQRATLAILGAFGTGKTVLLVHAANQLVEDRPDQSIVLLGFTHALVHLMETGLSDRAKNRLQIMTHTQFLSEKGRKCDVALVDEFQDISMEDLAKIRARTNHLMVLAGDHNQSIYDHGSSLDEVKEKLRPEIRELSVVYRVAPSLVRIASRVKPDAGLEAARMGNQRDMEPLLLTCEQGEEELSWLWEHARSLAEELGPGHPTLILLPLHNDVKTFLRWVCLKEGAGEPDFPKVKRYRGRWKVDYDPANALLAESSIPLRYLGNGYGDLHESRSKSLVFCMTYHSAKGLDFDNVILPGLRKGAKLYRNDNIHRSLLYVGLTRSKLSLVCTYAKSDPRLVPQSDLSLLLSRRKPASATPDPGPMEELPADLFVRRTVDDIRSLKADSLDSEEDEFYF